MATTGTLNAAERHRQLLKLLERDGAIQLTPASGTLGVSQMTIRRDLADLERDGLVRRVRGGALPPLGPRKFGARQNTQAQAKAVIAQKALSLVPTSGAVALDASTTVGALIESLPDHDGLITATNSLDNFIALRRRNTLSPVLIGGQSDERTDSLVGPLACQAASALLYHRFFTSASALDPVHGSSEVSLDEVAVKQAFSRASEHTVLCVDSSKLGRRDVAQCLALESVTTLITELDPTDARLNDYRELCTIL